MQSIQISDQAAQQLISLAAQEHTTSADLIERLITEHSQYLTKQREITAFFKPYQQDMTGFKFDRDEANER